MRITTDSQLPEKAIAAFNQRLHEIRQTVQPERRKGGPTIPQGSSISHVPKRHLGRDVVLQLSGETTVDILGQAKEAYYESGGQLWAVRGQALEQLQRIAIDVARSPAYHLRLSEDFILHSALDWLKASHGGPANEPFMAFLDTEAKKAVQPRIVRLPVAHLAIERPFQVGPATVSFVTKEFFDDLSARMLSSQPEENRITSNWLDRKRKKYQGTVTIDVETCADLSLALDSATAVAEKVLTCLRFFSPAAFVPELRCYVELSGRALIPARDVLYSEGSRWTTWEGLEEKREFEWFHSQRDVVRYRTLGFEELVALVFGDQPTVLQRTLGTTLRTFTRSLMAPTFEEKVVLMLAAGEALLLTGSQDPVQRTFAQRLAVLASGDLVARRRIVTAVRDAYSLRSGFLHHGKSKEDFDVLRLVQHSTWDGIINATRGSRQFPTPQNLQMALDDDLLGPAASGARPADAQL